MFVVKRSLFRPLKVFHTKLISDHTHETVAQASSRKLFGSTLDTSSEVPDDVLEQKKNGEYDPNNPTHTGEEDEVKISCDVSSLITGVKWEPLL